jgi:hypothetical protein
LARAKFCKQLALQTKKNFKAQVVVPAVKGRETSFHTQDGIAALRNQGVRTGILVAEELGLNSRT